MYHEAKSTLVKVHTVYESAAHVYFGKDASQLTLAQAALIAGLPQSPNYYSPFNDLEASKKRQAVVLGQMVKYGYITQEQADEARQADLGLVAKQEQTHEKSNASYFINYVIAQVSENMVMMQSIKMV